MQDYPARQPVNVEVFRGTTLLNSIENRRVDGTGLLEVNHVGGDDCFDDGTAPDVVPGDEILSRTTTPGAIHTDSMIVRQLTLQRTDTGPDTPNPGTAEAPLPNSIVLNGTGVAGDALALRIRTGGNRIDDAVTVAADGTWTKQFDVDPADFGEATAEFGTATQELTVDDGSTGGPCARTADTFVAPPPGPPDPLPRAVTPTPVAR